MIELKSPSQLQLMRQAGGIVAEILEVLGGSAKPGMTTLDLDQMALEIMLRRKSKPAFKGYRGYPAHICASVNEEVVHGIPSKRKLVDGDVLSIDVGVVFDGYYGDAAVTVPIGRVSRQAGNLIRATESSLIEGIAMATPEHRLSDISHAVQRSAESSGYSVVREFVGHGIGTQLHELPQIPNYGKPGFGPKLKPGMVLAIEPMVNQGGPEIRILEDGWTAVTKDGSLAAHFEHTVAVTEAAPEILTLCPKKKQSK